MNIEQFLMQNEESTSTELIKDVVVSDRFKDTEGNFIPFKIKSITRQRLTELSIQSEKIGIALDYLLIEESCTQPSFRSIELQNQYKLKDASKLIDKVLLPGEVIRLSKEILKLNKLDKSIDDMILEAKK